MGYRLERVLSGLAPDVAEAHGPRVSELQILSITSMSRGDIHDADIDDRKNP